MDCVYNRDNCHPVISLLSISFIISWFFILISSAFLLPVPLSSISLIIPCLLYNSCICLYFCLQLFVYYSFYFHSCLGFLIISSFVFLYFSLSLPSPSHSFPSLTFYFLILLHLFLFLIFLISLLSIIIGILLGIYLLGIIIGI